MSALRDAHRDTFFGNCWPGNSNEAQHDGVAGCRRLFEERQLVADRIGEHGLENETFPLFHQLPPERLGQASGGVRIKVQFPRQYVGVDEPQPGGLEMGVVESGFARAIRPRERDNDRAAVERQAHRSAAFTLTGWNWRLTNRPTVRFPSASMRTSTPA